MSIEKSPLGFVKPTRRESDDLELMAAAGMQAFVRGVSRMHDNGKALLVSFDRKLTDDELRAFHDFAARWRYQP